MKPSLAVNAHIYVTSGHIEHWIASLRVIIRNRGTSFNADIKRVAWIFCCLLVPSLSAFGTTVVGLRTGTEIVVAADARENDGKRILPNPTCKILSPDGRRFWASAQVYKEPLANFNIETLVNNVWASGSSLSQWVKAFDQKIVAELRRTIGIVKSKAPASYSNTYLDKHVLVIVFFGFENGVPTVSYRDYRTNAIGELLEPTKNECPGPNCPDTGMRYCLGGCAEVDEIIKQDKNWQRGGLVPTTRRLINAEIQADWTVGPPIDTLQIDRNGPRWVGQDPQSKCQPITPH